ncbi:ras-like GTP-binding protein RhoL [Lucilia sericata]|uniref:ras-like GTP-binding protein RhoL n=1 Tax=Lucilia sericata TaxID=13632 RepID=UPI0018A87EE9|nr:ras-like GTP-binding protein RhoL [Lucilia sericata]
MDGSSNLRILIVGNVVGKTTLLKTYLNKEFYESYYGTIVHQEYDCNITVDDKEYKLTLVDTAGLEEYKRLRPLAYPNTDCLVLCYSIAHADSFKHIEDYWLPEFRMYCKGVPFILVGTQLDLRGANSVENLKCLTAEQGHSLKDKIKAYSFVECSAKDINSLNKVIEEAVRAAINKPIKKHLLKSLFFGKK